LKAKEKVGQYTTGPAKSPSLNERREPEHDWTRNHAGHLPRGRKGHPKVCFGGEQALSGETCDRGILPMSVQPRTMVDQIAAEADKEEYGELSFRTASDVRSRRDKAQRFRRSPKNYLGIMTSLKAYDMVLEELFTSAPNAASPGTPLAPTRAQLL
jgi:hypothetical protein